MIIYLTAAPDASFDQHMEQLSTSGIVGELRGLAATAEDAVCRIGEWAINNGGTIISKDPIRLTIPAEQVPHIGRDVRDRWRSLTTHSCSVGLAMTLPDADRALDVAVLRGGDRIVFWTPEAAAELETAAKKAEEEEDEFFKSEFASVLTKGVADQLASFAVPDGTVAAPEPASESQSDPKAALIAAVQKIKENAKTLESLKDANPEAYEAVVGFMKATLSLASAVTGNLSKSIRSAAFYHPNTGRVIETGPFHDSTFMLDDPHEGGWVEGFTTNDGTFLDRYEAAQHVKLTSGGTRDILYSQDPEAFGPDLEKREKVKQVTCRCEHYTFPHRHGSGNCKHRIRVVESPLAKEAMPATNKTLVHQPHDLAGRVGYPVGTVLDGGKVKSNTSDPVAGRGVMQDGATKWHQARSGVSLNDLTGEVKPAVRKSPPSMKTEPDLPES